MSSLREIERGPKAADDIRDQISRILGSRTFARRQQLCRLLGYLAERSLDDDAPLLKEYTVGVEVFGKSEGYDPQQDAYARNQMAKLRQALSEYYRVEGQDDPIHVDCPFRQFRLSFSTPEESSPAVTRHSRRYWAAIALIPLVAALVFAAGWFGARVKSPRALNLLTAEQRELWMPYLTTDRQVVMVIGAMPFLEYEEGVLREPALDTADQADRDGRIRQLETALRSKVLPHPPTYMNIGDAQSAFLLGIFYSAAAKPLRLVRSDALTWDDIATTDLIFVGNSKGNPHVLSLPVERAFQLRNRAVLNLKPRPGEPAAYEAINPRGKKNEGYALISRFSALHGNGHIMVIEGPFAGAQLAATQFVTESKYVRLLLARLRGPGQALPAQFQVVILGHFRDSVPVAIDYVAHREL
jgi:hypothetical protein